MVWPENAPEARVTITRVTLEPGAFACAQLLAPGLSEAGTATPVAWLGCC